MQIVHSRFFHWNKEEREFSIEASDLLHNTFRPEDFLMISEWTGKSIRMAIQKPLLDNEGEVYGWGFYNEQHDIKVVVFND